MYAAERSFGFTFGDASCWLGPARAWVGGFVSHRCSPDLSVCRIPRTNQNTYISARLEKLLLSRLNLYAHVFSLYILETAEKHVFASPIKHLAERLSRSLDIFRCGVACNRNSVVLFTGQWP